PEVASLAPLVRLASTPEDFEGEIAASLAESDLDLITKRRAFAKENTWKSRFELLAPAVRNAFPKASIVVVTFNNLDLNRLCLESLYERTEWPNFEVVVVDNGSTDGTAPYLSEARQRFPNLRLILNETNRGFAAANNAGLQTATGDYFVLLNNDTVLARGWLSALIRHLHVNPNIGLIGPATNAIGNEAMISVEYNRIEDMPAWAAGYLREHDGELFEIRMLGMFCVAMRRTTFERVGPLDERFGIGMFEDDDYAHRLRNAGYRIVCTRDSFVHHWMRASFRKMPKKEYRELFARNQTLFEQKWGIAWQPHARRSGSPASPPLTTDPTATRLVSRLRGQ
ncbi:MAG: glycosyltransferase family 2 protein, partial [Thermoanaerobaculia bacterium]